MINKKGIDIILTIAYPVVMPKYIVSVDAMTHHASYHHLVNGERSLLRCSKTINVGEREPTPLVTIPSPDAADIIMTSTYSSFIRLLW